MISQQIIAEFDAYLIETYYSLDSVLWKKEKDERDNLITLATNTIYQKIVDDAFHDSEIIHLIVPKKDDLYPTPTIESVPHLKAQ